MCAGTIGGQGFIKFSLGSRQRISVGAIQGRGEFDEKNMVCAQEDYDYMLAVVQFLSIA